VHAALAHERLSLPAGPALAQAHPGKLGHEVELGGPRVTERNREALESSVHDLEVMGREALRRDVVLVDPPSRLAQMEGAQGLTGRKPPEPGHAYLDDEAAAGREVRRDVTEARDLSRLRRQVRDRVEDQVRDGERPVDPRGRKVPDRHRDVRAVRLCVQLRDHRLGHVDPGDGHSALSKRDSHPTCSDAELERTPAPGQLGQEVDGGVDARPVEHVVNGIVVARGDGLAEVTVVVHPGNLAHAKRAGTPTSIRMIGPLAR
jgi:hypothetical protein